MRAVKGRDTTPELVVRKLLHEIAPGYRLHRRDLPGAPDIAYQGRKKAIFVHGCFWHGHDCKRGARVPRANADYWSTKIARNRARDEKHRAAYDEMGWGVLTIWECELKEKTALAARLVAFLAAPSANVPAEPKFSMERTSSARDRILCDGTVRTSGPSAARKRPFRSE